MRSFPAAVFVLGFGFANGLIVVGAVFLQANTRSLITPRSLYGTNNPDRLQKLTESVKYNLHTAATFTGALYGTPFDIWALACMMMGMVLGIPCIEIRDHELRAHDLVDAGMIIPLLSPLLTAMLAEKAEQR